MELRTMMISGPAQHIGHGTETFDFRAQIINLLPAIASPGISEPDRARVIVVGPVREMRKIAMSAGSDSPGAHHPSLTTVTEERTPPRL
jgi:hypothetical protein